MWYIAKQRKTGKMLCRRLPNKRHSHAPCLYESAKRAKQALALRIQEVADPNEWDVIPVTLNEKGG